MKAKTIGGLFVVLIGMVVVVYASFLWNSNFQLNKATNPSFVTNSLVVSVEYIILIIIGILAFICGGLIINKDKTLQIMRKLSENLARKTA
jgi:uncharacterized membrane protein YidH (DUF202 family)